MKKPVRKAKKKVELRPDGKPYKFRRSTRSKMSKSHTGKKLSEETKQKIRDARREREALIQMGLLEPFRHSEETKKRLSKIMKRKKHQPSRKSIRKSAEERSLLKEDRSLARKVAKGKL